MFKYDYMGRRIRKMVYDWDTQASDWEDDPSSDLYFMYENNGWNVIMVLDGMDGDDEGDDPDFTTLTKYTWGLDMSGTLHGAGNIGGLLGAYETQGTSSTADDKKYWFVYDGNGNVGQIFDFTDDIYHPTVAARYEYDPYGQIIGPDTDEDGDWRDNATAYALANPFRFSTKWLDEDLRANDQTGAIGETGLYYYGHRYYSPSLGRWVNRDPVEEESDLNLYLFVQNAPMNRADYLGLLWGFTNCRQLQNQIDPDARPTWVDQLRAADRAARANLPSLRRSILRAIAAPDPYPVGTRARLGVAAAITVCARARLVALRVQCEPDDNRVCDVIGAIAYVWGPQDNTIHICPAFFDGDDDRTDGEILVHEATHMCGTTDGPPPPNGIYFNLRGGDPRDIGRWRYEWIASSYDTWLHNGFCVPHYTSRRRGSTQGCGNRPE